MTTSRQAAASTAANATINLWVNRGLESLWLLMVLLVPLAFLSRDYATSEAVISNVEVPKVALLRILAALIASLWLIEWAAKGLLPIGSRPSWEWSKVRPSEWLPRLASWLRDSPGHWLVLAAWFFLATTLLSTALSGSLATSVWGEIPGQDGYPAYTVVAYLLAFGIIATHLRTRPQLWRLLGAVVIMGVMAAGYGVFQHYRVDFFDLTEVTGGRVTSFMGNTIFAAAVMSMTIPITLVLAAVTLRDSVRSAGSLRDRLWQILGELGLTSIWSLILAVQFLGIAFTLSRGPWVGTAAALAIFVGLVLLFLGWRSFWRVTLVLALAAAFALAILQYLGSISILGQTAWFGVIMALLAIGGAAIVIANWRYLGRAAGAVALVAVLAAAVALGPSWLGRAGSAVSTGSGQSVSDEQATAGEIAEGFSSIQSTVLGGFIGGRRTHWSVSWQLIRDHPWFEFDSLSIPWLRPLVGYGPDLFRFTYLLRSPGEGESLSPLEPDQAHNFFIHQTVEQGFLGLLSALGLFLAVFVTGAYQLLRRGFGYSNIHKLVLIGLAATIAGRFLEMMVGVARVSDLMVLWVLLAIFAALPVVMKDPEEDVLRAAPDPQPTGGRRRDRRRPATSGPRRNYDWRLFMRLALVVWLLGGIGVLTWVKGVNYVRAAVSEGEGLKHAREGDLQATLASFDRAIDLAPDVPTYHINRARVFFAYQFNEIKPLERGCSAQRDPTYNVCLAAQAMQSNLNGVGQSPFYYRSRLALANSAFNLKLDEDVIKSYKDGSALVPGSWLIKNEVAKAYLEAGQPEDALPVLRESLKITEGTKLSADGLHLQGRAYRDLGQPDEGARLLERALALNSGASWAEESIEMLVDYYSGLGREASLDRLNEAIRRDSGDAFSYYLRGLLSAEMGLADQAYEDFSQSINLAFGQPELFAWRGRMSQILGNNGAALRDLSTAVLMDPQSAENRAYLGELRRSGGSYFEAVQNLEQALRLDPLLSLAYHFRGLLLHDLGLYQRAIHNFDFAISRDPDLVDAYSSRDESNRQLELFAQTALATPALEELIQSFSLEFTQPEHLAWRGRMAQLLGRVYEALSDLNTAVRLDPQNAEYYAYLGDAYRYGRTTFEAEGQLRWAYLYGTTYFAAVQNLERAILLDPQLSVAFHFRGQLHHALGLYQKAIQDFNQAISLDPGLADAHSSRAESNRQLELFAQSGLATQAFEDLSQSYSPEFSESEHFVWRGRMAQLLGDEEAASGHFNRAVSLDPQNAEAYAYLGDFYRSGNTYLEAGENLEQAILLDPQLGVAYLFRGLLQHDLGLYQEAIRDFDQAISLDAGLADAHNGRANSFLQLGQNEQAIQDLDRAIAIDPRLPQSHRLRGKAHLALQEYETAVLDLNQALNLGPQFPEALAMRGRALLALGRDQEVAQDLEKVERALGSDPSVEWAPEAFDTLDKFYSRLGMEATLDRLNEAIRRNPEDSVAHYFRGQVFAQKGLSNQAFEDFNRSFDLGFDRPGLFAWRGRMAELLGDEPAALRDLNRAIQMDPQNAKYYVYLGNTYRSVTKYFDAVQNLEQAILLDPQLSLAYHVRGLLYHDLGLYQRAIQDFDQGISLDPALADAYRSRDESYRQLELFAQSDLATQAFEALSQSFSPEFSRSEFLYWQGRMAQLLGRSDDALRDLFISVRLDLQNAEYYAYLGDVYRSVESYFEAGQNLELAILLDPQLGVAYLFRGLLHHDLGLYQKAIQDFDQVITLDPELVDAHSSRAESSRQLELFAQTGLATQGFDDLNQSYSPGFSPSEFFTWRGRMAQLLGDEPAALRHLNTAVSLDPQNAEVYAYLGDFYRSGKLYFEAVQNLEEAIRLDPQLGVAYNLRGLLHHNLDLYQRAIQDFDQAIVLAPGLVEAHSNRAESSRQLELLAQTGLASQVYEELSRSYSPEFSEPEHFAWRGRMAQLLGRYNDALSDLKWAVNLDPQNAVHYYSQAIDLDLAIAPSPRLAEAYLLRGQAHIGLQDYEAAVVDLNQALNLSPQLMEAFTLRSGALLALGRDEEAAQDLEQAELLKGG